MRKSTGVKIASGAAVMIGLMFVVTVASVRTASTKEVWSCSLKGQACQNRCSYLTNGDGTEKAANSPCRATCDIKLINCYAAEDKKREAGDKKEGGGKIPPKGGKKGDKPVVESGPIIGPRGPVGTSDAQSNGTKGPQATGTWTPTTSTPTAPQPSATPVTAPTKPPRSPLEGILSKPYGGKWLP